MTKQLPDFLYYTESQLNQNFSSTGNAAQLDINRVLNGYKDVFRTQEIEETPEPKKIIFSNNYDVLPLFFNEALQKLEDCGFEVYGLVDGDLKRITNKDTYKSGKVNPDIIKSFATTNNLARDKYIVVDEVELAIILNKELSLTLQQLRQLTKEYLDKLKEAALKDDIIIKIDQREDDGDIEERLLRCINFAEKKVLMQLLKSEDEEFLNIKSIKTQDEQCIEIIFKLTESFYKRFPNLEELNLAECWAIRNLKDLPQLKSLRKLDLSRTPITSEALKKITESCPDLEELNLESCQRIKNLEDLSQLKSLRKLNLSKTSIASEALKKITESCLNLEELNLEWCQGIENLKDLSQLKSLRKLNLLGTLIASEDLKKITESCPDLEELNLESCQGIKNLKDLPQLKSLRKLNLSGTPITSEDLKKITESCPDLEELNLRWCRRIKNLKDLPQLKSLRKLDLSRTPITSEDLKEITESCPDLEELNLRWCQGIKNLKDLPQLKSLRKLNLLSGTSITSEDLKKITESCPDLEELNLELCQGIKNLKDLSRLKSLRKLNLSRTPITNEDLKKITESCPDLEELNLESYQGIKNLKDLSQLKSLRKALYTNKDPEKPTTSFEKAAHHNQESSISEIQLDTLTRLTNNEFKATKIFKPKEIGNVKIEDYRIDVFDEIDVNSLVIRASNNEKNLNENAKPVKDLEAKYSSNSENKTNNIFLGKIDIQNGEFPIPTLTASDKILSFEIINAENADITINFCERKRQYYAKVSKIDEHKEHRCQLVYEIEKGTSKEFSPNPNSSSAQKITKITLEENGNIKLEPKTITKPTLDQLAEYFLSFEEKVLDESDQKKSVLSRILFQKAGVCRHRAFAFKAVCKKLFGDFYQVNVCLNEIHAFVEVINTDKTCIKYDLGGAIVPIEINDPWKDESDKAPNESDKAPKEKQIAEEPSPLLPEEASPSLKLTKKKVFDNILCNQAKNTLLAIDLGQIEPLLAYAQRLDNCYVIFDLDDIKLHQNCIDEETGEINELPTALLNFLNSDISNKILLIDWSSAKSRHTALNNLLDSTRRIGGKEIPTTKVISIIPEKNLNLIGPDFYSRHQEVIRNVKLTSEPSETSTHLLQPSSSKEKDLSPSSSSKENIICFYNSEWKSILYGKIIVDDKGNLKYEESQLLKIIQKNIGNKNLIITLRNAPFHDREFRLALEKIIAKREIELNGKKISFNNLELDFYKLDEPYQNLEILKYQDDASHENNSPQQIASSSSQNNDLQQDQEIEKDLQKSQQDNNYEILNESTANCLLNSYRVEGNKISALPQKDKEKSFLLTEDLTNGMHGLLMKHLHSNNIQASFFYPDENSLKNSKNKILTTNDLNLCRDKEKELEDSLVIHINPHTSYSDLVEAISYDRDKGFARKECQFLEEIRSGNKVILVGNPSKELSHQLQSLFIQNPYLTINGTKEKIEGSVTLICEKPAADKFFKTFQKTNIHFTQEDIWRQFLTPPKETDEVSETLYDETLSRNAELLKTYLKELSKKEIKIELNYSQLKSALNRMKLKPKSNPLKHLLRLRIDYPNLKPILEEAWKDVKPKLPSILIEDDDGPSSSNSTLETAPKKRSLQDRIDKIKRGLENSQYIFLVGPSGSGKTSAIRNFLSDEYYICEGIENLHKLAESSHEGKPIMLLFDEANLFAHPKLLNMLENLLFNKTLLINGEIVKIPPQNKIIFTGNYRYFTGRKDIDFITNNGNIISWKALSVEEIKQDVVAPILKGCLSQDFPQEDLDKIATKIAIFYEKLSIKGDKSLTPRDIEMICLRLINNIATKKTGENLDLAVALAIYDEITPNLNKSDRKNFRKELEEEFGFRSEDVIKNLKSQLKTTLVKSFENEPNSNLKIVKSRENLFRHLDDFLAISDIKLKHPEIEQKGKGGLLITGESGAGKTYAVDEYLKSRGYILHDFKNPETDKTARKFCYIDASNFVTATEQLEIAFENGYVAVINEVNSIPLENQLNNYLSGYNSEGKKAKNSGFTLICTQNPPELYSKRIEPSPALKNRFTEFKLKDYKEEELEELVRESLIKGGADGKDADKEAKIKVRGYFSLKKGGLPLTPHSLLSP